MITSKQIEWMIIGAVIFVLIFALLSGCADYRVRFAEGFSDAYMTHYPGQPSNLYHYDHSGWIRIWWSYYRLYRDEHGQYYMEWNKHLQDWDKIYLR